MSDVAPTAECSDAKFRRTHPSRTPPQRLPGSPGTARSKAERAERPAGDPNAPTSATPPHDFADRVRRERGNNMFLVRGNDSTGRPAWYFVLVDPAKKVAFRKAFSGQVELNAYGRIVASGYGADPPASVRDRMKAEYGFTGE